jgi:hypothetical protein
VSMAMIYLLGCPRRLCLVMLHCCQVPSCSVNIPHWQCRFSTSPATLQPTSGPSHEIFHTMQSNTHCTLATKYGIQVVLS